MTRFSKIMAIICAVSFLAVGFQVSGAFASSGQDTLADACKDCGCEKAKAKEPCPCGKKDCDCAKTKKPCGCDKGKDCGCDKKPCGCDKPKKDTAPKK